MIISSGKFKGRKLIDNQYSHIRPTADIVKQAMFNKLSFFVQDAKVLDLFCGTGSLGIEAISRGAKEVVFADKDARSLSQTKQNLKNLEICAERTIKGDFKEVLKRLEGEKFDMILLDPPYMSGVYQQALKLIKDYDLLSEKGVVVCEHDKNVEIKSDDFLLVDQKRYGTKMLTYFNKKSQSI